MYYFKYSLLKVSNFVYCKFNKYKNFKNNFFYNYFHLLLIILIGSNHPNRFELFMKKKDYLSIFKNINWKLNKKAKNIYIVLGDSHSELYGRNYKSNQDNNASFITIWLGPILLIKFLKSSFLLDRSIFLINKIVNFFGKSKTYHVIFSFGEIDVRSSFFRMLEINRSYKNLDDLLNNYSKQIRKSIEKIKIKTGKKIYINFYFKEPPPTTYKIGYLPKNRNEMIEIYQSEEFPVMGNLEDRILWHSNLRKIILENSDLFLFLENSKKSFDSNGALNKNISDNIHITSTEIIEEFQNNLINLKRN